MGFQYWPGWYAVWAICHIAKVFRLAGLPACGSDVFPQFAGWHRSSFQLGLPIFLSLGRTLSVPPLALPYQPDSPVYLHYGLEGSVWGCEGEGHTTYPRMPCHTSFLESYRFAGLRVTEARVEGQSQRRTVLQMPLTSLSSAPLKLAMKQVELNFPSAYFMNMCSFRGTWLIRQLSKGRILFEVQKKK